MSSYRDQWREQGYLVLRNAVPADRVAALRAVSERIYEQWKAESTPESEPGGHSYMPRGWSLLHLNHPKYHVGRPDDLRLMLESVGAGLHRQVLRDIFTCGCQMSQTNLYVDPPPPGWDGIWHRDCQFFLGDDEAALNKAIGEEGDPPREVHMHIPLVPTSSTGVVPGSHMRPDTEGERRVRVGDNTGEMPGGIMLPLEPGDLAFFHVNTIHRGSYAPGVPRRTIAITYCSENFPRLMEPGEIARRAGYVAVFQPWFLIPGYVDGLSAETRAFYDRFIAVYGHLWTPETLDVLSPGVQGYYRPSFEAAGLMSPAAAL